MKSELAGQLGVSGLICAVVLAIATPLGAQSTIVPAGVALADESGPINGMIDPGETVRLVFALRNSGGTNIVNLTAQLLTTNGVTALSGPQNYGVLIAHGPSASWPFVFRASLNAQTITPVLQLQDGSTPLGTVVFPSFANGAVSALGSNGQAIIINDLAKATPYPSVINVSSLNGLIGKATVTFKNLSHTFPKDIDALLVSPTGQKTYLMAHCGYSFPNNNVSFTFDDAAAADMPYAAPLVSGSFRPTCYAPSSLPFPAPPAPYATNLSVFNGSSPNGAWGLYVYDDSEGDVGVIAGGWSLNLFLTVPVPAAADLALAMRGSAQSVPVTSNLTYTITVTNFGPASASNVVVTNTLPSRAVLLAADLTQGSVTNTAGVVTWRMGSLATDATATLTLVVQTGAAGMITNSAVVTSTSTDPNPDDDTASWVTMVTGPIADLALTMTASPPVVALVTSNLSYMLTVTNLGPSNAANVVVTNTLPDGAVLGAANSTQGTVTNAAGLLTWSIGSLAANDTSTLTLVVQREAAGMITNSAMVTSTSTDPNPDNDTASVVTIVVVPEADLVLGLADSPDPVTVGGNLTYTLSVSNCGPAVAPGVTLVDTLPPAVSFVSAWPSNNYTVAGQVVTFLNLGNVPQGGQVTAMIVVRPTAAGTFLNVASCGSGVADPFRSNNNVSIKTIVEALQLSLSHDSNSLTLSWPADAADAYLEATTSLNPPAVWTPVTNPPPVVLGRQKTITLPIGSGAAFFRLQWTMP